MKITLAPAAEYGGIISAKLCLLSLSVPILVLGVFFATYLHEGQASALATACLVFAIAAAADTCAMWRGSPAACLLQLKRMNPLEIDASDHTQRVLLCADAAASIILASRGCRAQDAVALEAFMTGMAAGFFGDQDPGHHCHMCEARPSDWQPSQIRLACKIGLSHGASIRRAINESHSGRPCAT